MALPAAQLGRTKEIEDAAPREAIIQLMDADSCVIDAEIDAPKKSKIRGEENQSVVSRSEAATATVD